MRYKNLLFAIVLGLVLPWLLLLSVKPTIQKKQKTVNLSTLQPVQEVVEVPVLLEDGTVENMPLEEYLVGVLMGEMPASFEQEALKAQAVAARTFTCKSLSVSKHPEAAVCTSAICCQGYYTQQQYIAQGGRQQDVEKLRSAVTETAGQVACYEGELIVATYFSCSGGRTEDAVAVWGADVPYLQAVDSPGEEDATHFMDTVTFDRAEFEQMLDISLADGVGDYVYSEGGGVDQVRIGDKTFSGTELRKKLNLYSTALVISIAGDKVSVTTKGFGHRVGMSQFGANAMASSGYTYTDILQYYYTGVTITQFEKMMV